MGFNELFTKNKHLKKNEATIKSSICRGDCNIVNIAKNGKKAYYCFGACGGKKIK